MVAVTQKEMTRDQMIQFIKDNPGVHIAHRYFSEGEYIFMHYSGNVYDENGYLFEDWYSIGPGAHAGIRDREGGLWETGWFVKQP